MRRWTLGVVAIGTIIGCSGSDENASDPAGSGGACSTCGAGGRQVTLPPPAGGSPNAVREGGAPASACREPCGGSPVGTWRFKEACSARHEGQCIPELGSDLYEERPTSLTGILTYAGGRVTGSVVLEAAATSRITATCVGVSLSANSCEAAEGSLRDNPDVTSSQCILAASACRCEYTVAVSQTYLGHPYRVEGSKLYTSGPQGEEVIDFCVSEDTLTFRAAPYTASYVYERVQPDGGIDSGPNASPDSGQPVRPPCTPGAPLCDAEVATTCDPGGLGPAPGGDDCAVTGKVCVSGTCRDVICSGRHCSSGHVHECSERGTVSTRYVTCGPSEYCDVTGGTATCRQQTCSPNLLGCNGSVIATCNADGTGWLSGGTDCSASNQGCANATCLPIVCTPSATFCQNGNVFSCHAQGVSSSLVFTCPSSEHCYQTTPSTAFCRADVCTPGASACRDGFATTCLADGSGPEPIGGTDCTLENKSCIGGSCQVLVCAAGQRYCAADVIKQCNPDGTASSVVTACPPSQYCDASGTSPACVPDVCSQGLPACDGERATSCSINGSSYDPGGTDCAGLSEICNESAVCAPSAVDGVGGSGLSLDGDSQIVANRIAMGTSRRLTQIEVYLTVPGTSVFTWVVYEETTTLLYTKIFERTTSGTATGNFVGSGPIDVPLDEGRQYLVGVLVQGSFSYVRALGLTGGYHPSFGDVFAVGTVSAPTPPVTVSPGGFLGGGAAWIRQRLTTAPPP